MLKVSFILPCFNVAPYIGRCIESIERQDMSQDEYEIICVDDCSPDNSGDIIRDYQNKYSNIIYHRHEINKTSGGARNTGIDLARGEYIWFVDPDDEIELNVLNIIYQTAVKRETEILLFNLRHINESGKETEIRKYFDCEETISGQEYVLKYCSKNSLYDVAAHCCCLFKKEFIITQDIRYPEIKSSQDVVFVWKAVLLARRMSSINTVCYRYIRRIDSMTGSEGKKKADATLSASVLYPFELQRILDTFEFIDYSFIDTIKRDIVGSVNDDSRSLFKMTSQEVRNLYYGLNEHHTEVDSLRNYMNRKTRHILNYRMTYFFWRIMVETYKLYGYLK